jgi:hypothetical protein
MAKDGKRKGGTGSHYPAWYEAVQRHAFIPAIILVEGIVYGLMFTWGLAPGGTWETWDWTTRGMVAVMFVAGFLCGGMVLRCSLKSATSFGQGRWGFGLFNFLGIILFIVPEIWAGIVERAGGFPATPPDRVVLEMLGFNADTAVVLPSVIAIAVLPAIVGLYYGFSEQETEEEDPEAIRRRADVAAIKIEAAQRLRAARVRGLVALTRDTIVQARGGEDEPEAVPPVHGLDEQAPAPFSLLTGGVSSDKDGAAAQAGSRAKAPGSIPPGQWTAARFAEWVQATYGYALDAQTAKDTVKVLGKGRQAQAAQGAPYIASITSLKAWAKKQEWAAALARQA